MRQVDVVIVSFVFRIYLRRPPSHLHLSIYLGRELSPHVPPRHRVEVWIVVEVGFYRGLPFLKIALPSVSKIRDLLLGMLGWCSVSSHLC
jgi:hypothetical protein